MKTKITPAVFLTAFIFLFFQPLISLAQDQDIDDAPEIPGIIEGTGTHFEITDSEYLNIILDSCEKISARIESAPEMIVLEIKASDNPALTNLNISGLNSNTIYHKYTDDYHNYTPITTDENGAFSFDQDISQNHIIFIQPRKSTKFIQDNATGGNCTSIGSWDASSKTCTLNQDVFETIQIDNDGITLDGGSHLLNGSYSGSGIYVSGKTNVVIRNITASHFFSGIILYKSNNIKVSNVVLRSNQYGISQSNSSQKNTIENNIVTNNTFVGISSDNSNYITLRNNTVESSVGYGIYITSSNYNILSGNIISGNASGNFSITGGDMSTNDIDASNTTEGKPILYKKNISGEVFDGSIDAGSLFCINCDNIIIKELSLPKNGSEIFFWHTNNSLIEDVISVDESLRIGLNYASNNIIKNNDIGILKFLDSGSSNNQIYNNNFLNTSTPVYIYNYYYSGNLFNLSPPTGGNYWKKNYSCKDANGDGFCDFPFNITSNGKVRDYHPLAKKVEHIPPTPPCCSSVMFLPGHQSSRLYRKNLLGEDQLWEPNNHNQDVEQLFLDENGESVDNGIYTRDIIGTAYWKVKDIYKGFIDSMNQFASAGAIKEWKPIPYDWRLPLEEIVDDGVKLENGSNMNIVSEIERMAAESKTGKVTLIGHSNGGLLAKVLIDKLKSQGKENLVDKLIMVATPQLGTPKAIASLLHGEDTDLASGLTLDKETGRSFGENMESAYNLLPSKEYFNVVETPVVEFSENVKNIYDFRALYGESIDNFAEFKKFILGDDGARTEPEEDELDSPNVLKESLFSKTETSHEKIDLWQAPESLEVVQIAGWGLDTISGIKYSDCDSFFCFFKGLDDLKRELILKSDGDKTVVVPSAVEMGDDAKRYYLNLFSYNQNTNIEHADILEANPLQDFIKNIIQNNENTLPDYITAEKPEVADADKRLRYRLHSPVKLDIYDNDGNHTGLIKIGEDDPDLWMAEEKIPNSYYMEFGDTKYAGSGEYAENIILTGEGLGTFTFDVDQIIGDQVSNTTNFSDIPTMEEMKAEISISQDGGVGEMKVDVDNDGEIDEVFHPGEEITKEDQLQILEKIVRKLDIDDKVKNRLVNKIENAKKQAEKDHSASLRAMLENIIHQIEIFSREQTNPKFLIPKDEAEKLIGIINVIID